MQSLKRKQKYKQGQKKQCFSVPTQVLKRPNEVMSDGVASWKITNIPESS